MALSRLTGVAVVCVVVAGARPATAVAITLLANPDSYNVRHDRTLNVPAPGVLANDVGLLGGSTAVLASDVSHGTLALQGDGRFTYEPDAGYVGSDSFRYRARDGILLSLPATVTIAVTNAAPVAADDSYTASTGVTKNVPAPGVLANDTDADGDALEVELVDGGGSGSIDLNSDGSFTFKSGGSFVGDRTFTYRVSDGLTWSAVATVTIRVRSNATPAPTPTPTPPPPTPAPTPTPLLPLPTIVVPLPTIVVPLPTIVVPLPTIRPPVPTPTAAPTTRPTATPTTGPSATPAPTPSAASSATPSGPGSSPTAGPTPSDDGGSPPDDPNGGAGINVPPIDPFTPIDGIDPIDLGGFDWAVPSLVLSVPGLLLILAVLAQTGAGLVSLPFVRSSLGGIGIAKRRQEARVRH